MLNYKIINLSKYSVFSEKSATFFSKIPELHSTVRIVGRLVCTMNTTIHTEQYIRPWLLYLVVFINATRNENRASIELRRVNNKGT